MNFVQRLSGAFALLMVSFGAVAQDAIQPYVEYRKQVESSQNISPLDNGLFGDQVSLYNGSTTFSVTDIDIPGNNLLPVQLTRKFAVELQPQNDLGNYDALLRGIGNWDVDVPHMAATYSTSAGNALRCNGAYVPNEGMFRRSEVWQGISVNVPGRGTTLALGINSTSIPRPASGTYKLGTSERDVFDCIPMQSGFTGEGFRMTTSSGLRYYFDVGTSRTAARLVKYLKDSSGLPLPFYLDRNRIYLLTSKIEDRFGNAVEFQYNANGHPTRIWSSDGREINLAYTGGRLTSATSHGRTWQYQYTHVSTGSYARLSQVIQPDGSKWQYSYTDDLMPSPDPAGLPPLPWCARFPLMLGSALMMTATHPSGAVGIFNFNNRRHYRSGVHATECNQTGDPYNPDYDLIVPHFFDVMSIDSKTLSGPGLASMTWSYAYSDHLQTLWGTHTTPLPYPCTTCAESKTVAITNPDSTKSRYTFGIRYHDNDGRQLKAETLRADDTVIRAETNTYMTEVEAVSQPFHGVYGSVLGNYVSDPASVRVRPVTKRTSQQDGVNFVWQANTFDTMARPKSVTKSSTVPGSPSRTEETIYWDNTVNWILGQVSRVACTAPVTAPPVGCGSSGTEMFERTYDATYALPQVTERFNKPEQTLTWDTASSVASGQRGTAKTVKDGNNNITKLSNWKRGIPQSIKYPITPESPSGATQLAVVNNNGWIDSVTDENGYKTCYGYDAMGRVNLITYPSETTAEVCDTSKWASTAITFQPVAAAEYGIPAGHWTQTVQTGTGRHFQYFDALWRPLIVRDDDSSQITATRRVTRNEYDHEGRVTFTSYPVADGTPPAIGAWTEYDALGRMTSVAQDTELTPSLQITTTEYLAGFQTRVTNPKGQQTLTVYKAYDQPTYDQPHGISELGGDRHTEIYRDVFGKPYQLRRRNGTASQNAWRYYTYNANQELCRTVDPETGATLMGYDGAGNLAWSAAGLASTTACDATGTTPAVVARKASRTYDARNRVKTLSFPDGVGNQTWTYTPDGQPANLLTYNTNGGTTVANNYTYNRRRLLSTETLITPAFNWLITYNYNGNGHLSSQNWHGLTIDYAPNALGQPTQVGTYATGASYYPNGALKQFTYGNGIVHTMTQNVRQLPSRSTDCKLAGTCAVANRVLDLGYTFDANANVGAITDYTAAARQTRGMTYDGLDRLTQTTSVPFGTASYTYDALDNLTRVKVGASAQVAARDHFYCYNATTQRLDFVRNTSCSGGAVIALDYDVQGNLKNKNSRLHTFDFGNRLRTIAGGIPSINTSYLYDGLGRRVRDIVGGVAKHSQYSLDGKLMAVSDVRTGVFSEYFYLAGSLVAIRERDPANVYGVKYQHTDALGSPIAVTNASKTVILTNEFEPYGKVVNHAEVDGPLYTGHVQDASSGLSYMQQRYYDPIIGRFLSVDPVTALDNGDMRHFNRYAYAYNNPYKFTDPDGRCPWCVGAGIGVGLEIARQVVTGEIKDTSLKGIASNIGKAVVAGAAGATGAGIGSGVAKLTASFAVRAAANAAAGAAIGAASTGANNAIDGKSVTEGMGKGALVGGALGGAGSLAGDAADALKSAANSKYVNAIPLAERNLLEHMKGADPARSANPKAVGAGAAGATVGNTVSNSGGLAESCGAQKKC